MDGLEPEMEGLKPEGPSTGENLLEGDLKADRLQAIAGVMGMINRGGAIMAARGDYEAAALLGDKGYTPEKLNALGKTLERVENIGPRDAMPPVPFKDLSAIQEIQHLLQNTKLLEPKIALPGVGGNSSELTPANISELSKRLPEVQIDLGMPRGTREELAAIGAIKEVAIKTFFLDQSDSFSRLTPAQLTTAVQEKLANWQQIAKNAEELAKRMEGGAAAIFTPRDKTTLELASKLQEKFDAALTKRLEEMEAVKKLEHENRMNRVLRSKKR